MLCEYGALSPVRRTYVGHVWQLGVLSQRVNTQLVSGARVRLLLVATHFFFCVIIPPVFNLYSLNSNFSLDISFLFVVSFQNGTLAVSYTSHVQNSVYSTWCVLTLRAKAKPHFAYWRSLSMYKCKIAPFLPCNLLWLAVFYFTIASHGNCSQVCFSPAFWTCGLVWLTGRQAALLARCVYAGAGHSGHTALRSILEGLFRAAYTAV